MSRYRSSAARRIASRDHAAMTAACTPHPQVPCADLRDAVSADIRAAADGYRKPKRRDTSRRAICITDAAWPDHYPANVTASGEVADDATRGFAAADSRKWRGETRSTTPTPGATDHRLHLRDAGDCIG